jgi:hypothetical protein
MQAYKLTTHIPANRHLEITLPESFPGGDAEVIILAKPTPNMIRTNMSLREFSDWIKQQPPSGRTREEIDAQIAEERNAWGDD